MIFRLEYKNKALKTARVDIITPTGTGVETVEGTGYPFQLKYEGDKKNKSLMFLSSSAEINIYETPLFNIDTLKTSGEKDIRVNYYIDSVLEWTGFVIPDFFSREIGGDGVVSMVASDRLAVLDSEVLEGLPVTVTLRTLLSSCLAKTGLTLPLKTVVDFATVSGNTDHVLNHSIRSQRLTDAKGRSVNCKDIIKSILVATNSKLMQRKGAWWVVNKMQHELGGGRVYTSPTAFTNYVEDLISFTDVTRGAMRTIAPVAGGVGVFQEYGGGKLIPDNYNFKNGLTGWTNYNGFTASTNNRRVLGYTQSGSIFTPIYDVAGTSEPYLVNRNISPIWVLFPPPSLGNIQPPWDPYAIKSTRIISPVISGDSNAAKVTVDVNAVGLNGTYLPFSVVLKRPGRENLFLNRDNGWQTRAIAQLLSFKNDNGNNLAAVSAGMSVSAVISAASSGEVLDDVGTYTIELLIFGSGIQGDNTVGDNTTLINSASVQFSAASNDTPKGTLYKADQGGESYTKIHDTETTVFGDYLTGGLNGYFYNYAPDDTSSLLTPNGSRSQPAWVNTFTQNTEPLPLLQQTIRQMRRMFSVAHDFIKGEIDVSDFDPLSIFEDCERRFVIVEAEFDFLRGSLQVVLEEVAYQNLTVREYIYSYFGEGDEGIRGISGISAGSSGGGGGGGMAPEPSWLENEITIDSESGLLSVDGWHVRGDLIIEGQVNQWLAQQLVVDDARIQVNRRQGGATVDSGLVIYNKDTSSEVSSLVYDVNGIWRAGGQRLYTDAYKPLADNATNLGGYSAASYPRKAEDASITGLWSINRSGEGVKLLEFNIERKWYFEQTRTGATTGLGLVSDVDLKDFEIKHQSGIRTAIFRAGTGPNVWLVPDGGNVLIGGSGAASERLHVVGNGLFTGNLTTQGNLSAVDAALSGTLGVGGAGTFGGDLSAVNAALSGTLGVTGATTLQSTLGVIGAATLGGNVGTSNFASQLQGWRVTPQGQADFRHIYTDELQAKAFTADISQALVGSDVLTKSVAKLAQNFTVTVNGTTAPLYVEELEGFAGLQVFAVNDILLIRIFDRSGGGLLIKNVWVEVASYVGTTDNVQQFTVNVINSGGVAGQMAYAGSMILDYGQSGSGLIQRTVLDQQGSPYSRVTTWENNPWTPENFTLHYQSGNLNGLANAEGWGVYSQNSFLTGRLLVGDLTKAGQYMEYENGQLNIKGQITVTGGNAATKEDVDAVQVGGRNLLRNSSFEGPAFYTLGSINGGISTISDEYAYDGSKAWKCVTTGSTNASGGYIQISGLEIGGTYTFSVRVMSLNAAPVELRIITTVWGTVEGEKATLEAGLWQRVSVAFEATASTLRLAVINGAYEYPTYYIDAIKLETGNRATDWTPAPEDVDAGITAAETSAKGYADGAAAAAESAAKTFATSEATAAESAAKGYTDDLTTRVENTLGLAALEGINQTLITDGKVRTALLEATDIVAQGITAGHVEGLTLNFDKGKIGGFNLDSYRMYYNSRWDVDNTIYGTELVATEGNQRLRMWRNATNFVDVYNYNNNDWGMRGMKNGSYTFQLGSTNKIAGINFDDSRIFTENWELNKDGSFYFGAGGTIDGGLIAGSIESANWDGTVGSRLNLLDGSLEFGNVIRIDAVTNHIVVKDGGTGQDGVKIGDFTLGGGIGSSNLDNAFSGSITTSANSENINLAGTVTPTGLSLTQNVIHSNIAQGAYTLKFNIKVNTLSRNSQAYSTIPAAPWDNNGTYGSATTTIKVFLGANIIYSSTKDCFLSEVTHNVNISFEGSGTLRCEVSIDGTKYYQFISGGSKSLFGYYGVISTNSARITLTPSANLLEISSKGFQSYWGPSRFFKLAPPTGGTNFVTARGQQEYISPNGTYRLKVSDDGIQKSTNGGQSWTTL